jgi:hypothetical protein
MHSSQSRKATKLSDSTIRQINTYALAAGAAGVGMLALTQPAQAEVVYTPVYHVIHANETYTFDLNNDGTPDFELKNGFRTNSGNSGGYFSVLPQASGNEVWAAAHAPSCGSAVLCAAALPKGTGIGPRGAFQPDYPDGEWMARSDIHGYQTGSWINVTRYLGLKFVIEGKAHYGWARLTVKFERFVPTATLTGYAYESTPNKSIAAGATTGTDDAESSSAASMSGSEPTTLYALALGAPGLSIWRRE